MDKIEIFWLIAAVGLFAVEAATVNLVSVWFALGALGALFTAFLGGAIWLQIVVFFVVTIITLIAMPQVLNQFSNYTGELEEKEKDLIVEAGRTYVELNSASFNTTKCIALDTLVGADLLNEKFVVESIGSDYNSKYKIKVTVNSNGHDITLVSAGEC